ncbi:unnamed protein product [Phaedon cochleariae]|uniref:Anticodon-binding domain-containing protein n=1 Tax=Phaedon cochleariae TaxID=80249 RepID=A0A9P0DGJ3_PHACE|nr:unnamed protein product [Phaedon cochleariae]
MLNKILELASKNGLLKKTLLPKVKIDQFNIGPIGLLLQNNLKLEWFYNVIINKDITVFPSDNNMSDTFDYAKDFCSQKLPFGIAEMKAYKKSYNSDEIIEYYKKAIDTEKLCFEDLLRHEENMLMKCTIFITPNNSTSFFHQWQRQRRMWWRKFSASPGKYSLSDIRSEEDGTQFVEISAKYDWGSQSLETLVLDKQDRNYSSNQLQFKEKKFMQAHTITSQVNLSTILLNSICDAFDEAPFQDKKRLLFRFHRKLAPYKISFALSGSNQASLAELNDLAMYLCKQLRSNHISTLFIPNSSRLTLDSQYQQYDQLGIPYTVLLNGNTLKNGIISLRSRDTTLKEQIHVTELVPYVEKLYRNY